MNLDQALGGCPVGLLNKMAHRRAILTDVATLRTELVQRLALDLGGAAREGTLWAALDGGERAAVALVARANGRIAADSLKRRIARRMGGSEPVAVVDSLIARLVESGVLFRLFDADGPARRTVYTLPDEYLDSPELPSDTLVVEGGTLVAADVRRNDPWFDCFVLASAIRRETWNVGGRRLVGGARLSLPRLLARLSPAVPDVESTGRRRRWLFFVELGRLQGWLHGGPWPLAIDDVVVEVLTRRAIEPLWAAYISTARRVPADTLAGPRLERGREAASAPVGETLELFGEHPVGQWRRSDEVARSIDDELPPDGGLERSVEPTTERAPSDRVHIRRRLRVEGWLSGPWYWLGLVDWGREGESWRLVTPNWMVTEVLGGRRAAAEAVTATFDRCVASGSLELTASPAVDLAALYSAEPYLSFVGGARERRYRVTAASVARGLRAGGSVGEVVELLERLLQGPLPAAWLGQLDRWEAQRGDLRLDARLLLTAANGGALRRVAELPAAMDGIAERLSERHAVVVPGSLGSLLQTLAEAEQPVTLGDGLLLAPERPERAAALERDAAELLWVLLEAVGRLDRTFMELATVNDVRAALATVLPRTVKVELERRASALADRLASRRDRKKGG